MNRAVLGLNKQGFCVEFTMLQNVPDGMIEIPVDLYPKSIGQKFDPVNMCWLDEYADWYVPPVTVQPEPTPQDKILSLLEQQKRSGLDKDEIMIEQLTAAEEIKLALENRTNFRGGGRYRLTCNPHPSSVWGCAA